MNKPCTYLFPVLAISFAFVCLGVPAQAVAQWVVSPFCYQCEEWDEDPEYQECDSENNMLGYLGCALSAGGKQCVTSSTPDGGADCIVLPGLDGWDGGVWASLDVESEPWPQVVAGTDVPRRVHQVASTLDVPLEVVRHGCTGAIIQRHYSSARVAELRSGLRRVTI